MTRLDENGDSAHLKESKEDLGHAALSLTEPQLMAP